MEKTFFRVLVGPHCNLSCVIAGQKCFAQQRSSSTKAFSVSAVMAVGDAVMVAAAAIAVKVVAVVAVVVVLVEVRLGSSVMAAAVLPVGAAVAEAVISCKVEIKIN